MVARVGDGVGGTGRSESHCRLIGLEDSERAQAAPTTREGTAGMWKGGMVVLFAVMHLQYQHAGS